MSKFSGNKFFGRFQLTVLENKRTLFVVGATKINFKNLNIYLKLSIIFLNILEPLTNSGGSLT